MSGWVLVVTNERRPKVRNRLKYGPHGHSERIPLRRVRLYPHVLLEERAPTFTIHEITLTFVSRRRNTGIDLSLHMGPCFAVPGDTDGGYADAMTRREHQDGLI